MMFKNLGKFHLNANRVTKGSIKVSFLKIVLLVVLELFWKPSGSKGVERTARILLDDNGSPDYVYTDMDSTTSLASFFFVSCVMVDDLMSVSVLSPVNNDNHYG